MYIEYMWEIGIWNYVVQRTCKQMLSHLSKLTCDKNTLDMNSSDFLIGWRETLKMFFKGKICNSESFWWKVINCDFFVKKAIPRAFHP